MSNFIVLPILVLPTVVFVVAVWVVAKLLRATEPAARRPAAAAANSATSEAAAIRAAAATSSATDEDTGREPMGAGAPGAAGGPTPAVPAGPTPAMPGDIASGADAGTPEDQAAAIRKLMDAAREKLQAGDADGAIACALAAASLNNGGDASKMKAQLDAAKETAARQRREQRAIRPGLSEATSCVRINKRLAAAATRPVFDHGPHGNMHVAPRGAAATRSRRRHPRFNTGRGFRARRGARRHRRRRR